MILIYDLTKLFGFNGGDLVTPRQHALMKLYDHMRPYIIKASFYEISQLCRIHLDHALITTLVEQ